MSINNAKTVYMIGIKGAGMAALAQILKEKDINVFGSDVKDEFFTNDVLKNSKIPFFEGFKASNVPSNADVIVSSNAYIDSDNPEILEVKKRGLTMLTYPEAVSELFNSSKHRIAICGTHGKSTTAAMLGYILEQAGLNPTVVIGSRINAWNSNGRAGKGDYFVIEADEYRDAFLNYDPTMILVTNIDYDHPDYFEDRHAYRNSFQKFFFSESVEAIIQTEKLTDKISFNLKMPGEYNQENANLAYYAALELGVEDKIAKSALESFSGIARRFEYYGEHKGALLFDDYAHHPKEVSSVIGAIKERYKDKKIKILFQPHTYSRTEKFFEDFCNSFVDADNVYILKTFSSAREKSPEDATGLRLAKTLEADYFEDIASAAEFIDKELSDKDVFVTLGAGIAYKVLEILKENK